MTDEYLPVEVGKVSQDEVEGDRKIEMQPRLAKAHYADMTENEAHTMWETQIICSTCASSPLCVVANNCQTAMTLISRCLAYIPIKG